MNPYQAYAPQAQAPQSFAPQAPAQAPAQALRPSIITSEALGADASAMTGWKYAAQAAPGLVSQLLQLRAQIEVEYPIRDIVVLGMGGSALGARVFEAAYYEDLARLGVRLRIVDTTEPSTIAGLLQDFDAAAGLVIVSSKSGGTIEPLCLGQIFFNHLSAVLGSAQTAAAHFIAISDADTPLSQLAITQAWRGLINTAPNVGGRFSALTAFGLAPLVLAGINPSTLIAAAQDMQCRCTEDASCNAGQLAGSLYQNMRDGHDKLIIAHDKRSEAFARWLEQILAESLGKNGKGLVPLPMPLERAQALLARGGADLQSISLVNMSAADVGEGMQRWMYATEKLAHLLYIDPFDQPNVEAVKQSTRRVLSEIIEQSSSIASGSPITSYAATTGSFASAGAIPVGDHLDQLLADPRIASPDRIVRLVKPDSFMVLVSWIPMNAENASSLEFLAATLQDVYQRPVVIAEGPHYLHASGQMYKGGPGTGVFLIVSQEAEQDLPIPGAAYSLRQLYRALFGGDLDVMLSMGKNLASL